MTEQTKSTQDKDRNVKGRFVKGNQAARKKHNVREITQEIRIAAHEMKVLEKTFKNLADIATGKKPGATIGEQINAAKVLAQYNLTSADKEIAVDVVEDSNKSLAEMVKNVQQHLA